MKDVSPAPTYVAMIPALTEAARDVGYALAVHGSMGRDLDLVAIPWTEEAVSAEALIMRLLSAGGSHGAHLPHRRDGTPADQGNGDVGAVKPHGRRAWSIDFENGLYLDVSVMQRAPGTPFTLAAASAHPPAQRPLPPATSVPSAGEPRGAP